MFFSYLEHMYLYVIHLLCLCKTEKFGFSLNVSMILNNHSWFLTKNYMVVLSA